ncbi:hypothetical protein [Jannaschia pohangensis]|uniref:Rhombotail lipoprotein n=1 Tax=Jannaschia pohangensis TaxID=390807 RepID=A0A1I3MD84_9RHOB|nr:hypothetical protein [Jannaschia pohangensis]SFI94750.1 hypothetical protein SAMN04488095_1804 [Jannaschia pohangensis]
MIPRPLLALLAAAMLAACAPTVQTTSGASYLARGPIADPAIRAAADIEPDLRFPARIGLARVVNGRLSLAPPEEAQQIAALAERYSPLGEWVALSPLVDGMTNGDGRDVPVIDRLRRTAARQHLDYILVYELGARSSTPGITPFALADVTLVGGLLLPTRTTQATGTGAAAFIDVRNGYPYGTVSTTEDLSGLARTFGADSASARLRDRATNRVARALLPEVEEMLNLLAVRANRR